MKVKNSLGEKTFNIFNVIFMCFLMVLMLYPLWYVLVSSLSDPFDIMAHRGILIKPLGFTFSSYEAVINNPNVLSGYANTIFIVVIGVIFNIIFTSLGAYFLSRKDVLLKKPITMLIIFTMVFHGGLVPFYLIVKGIGLYNSLWALIIPQLVNTYNMIIMRTAFYAIPESMEESAKLDGANDFTILFRIMMPLAKPTIAVLVLYYGVAHWNSWFHAMIFLRDRALFPLQLILREILIQNDTESMTTGLSSEDKEYVGETIKYAVIMVATLPILLLYPFLQKYFVKGVMIGAVKG